MTDKDSLILYNLKLITLGKPINNVILALISFSLKALKQKGW